MARLGFLTWCALVALSSLVPAAEPFRFPAARHGKGELRYVNSIPVLIVAGTPEEMGEQMGVLALKPAAGALQLFEDFLKDQGLTRLRPLMVKIGEGLLAKFPPEYRRELEAAAKAGGIDRDLLILGNTFHDIRKLAGCSALLVDPARSTTGGPLVGRNLDYPLLKGMQAYTLVIVYRPVDRRPFAVVAFPGATVIGCAMSAMNADGLVLGQNDVGLAADDSPMVDLKNTPTAVLARRILEECSTLEEAEKRLKADKPAGRSIFVACDRQGGGVFEVTPKTVVLRRGSGGICEATNRFESKELAVAGDCPRALALAQAFRLDKLGIKDVAAKMNEVNQEARTAHTMVFEPRPLKLHLAIGDGEKSATRFPLKEVDLAEWLKR
jgi:isopenicillin-N N-acyltransferase-like protein